jgi:hypothetical protein
MNGRKRKRVTRKSIGNKEEKDTRKLVGIVRTPINETTRMYLLKNRTNKERPGGDRETRRKFAPETRKRKIPGS